MTKYKTHVKPHIRKRNGKLVRVRGHNRNIKRREKIDEDRGYKGWPYKKQIITVPYQDDVLNVELDPGIKSDKKLLLAHEEDLLNVKELTEMEKEVKKRKDQTWSQLVSKGMEGLEKEMDEGRYEHVLTAEDLEQKGKDFRKLHGIEEGDQELYIE